uniref:Uncharacterized protein n=1 Tax=Ascaris lumbricoides TaxID=6252 RepID=A0A0M3I038_ASCLU
MIARKTKTEEEFSDGGIKRHLVRCCKHAASGRIDEDFGESSRTWHKGNFLRGLRCYPQNKARHAMIAMIEMRLVFERRTQHKTFYIRVLMCTCTNYPLNPSSSEDQHLSRLFPTGHLRRVSFTETVFRGGGGMAGRRWRHYMLELSSSVRHNLDRSECVVTAIKQLVSAANCSLNIRANA